MANEDFRYKLRLRKDVKKESTKKLTMKITISSALEKLDKLLEDGYGFPRAVRLAADDLPEHLREEFYKAAEKRRFRS
ncbi:MAG: hypothetical protein N3D73_02020 [Candidatus Diapherotrites archaeon]|nr:hypothetical protein [Candidatus Diapherotrites archaeon]